MRKRVLNNKKGFTLVELIVVVALMAVLAGTVTPSVYYSTERRQKSTAEYDTQMIYRNCIAGITFLSGQGVTPTKPYTTRTNTFKQLTQSELDAEYGVSNVSADTYYDKSATTNFIINSGWYVEYSRLLTKRIYQTLTGLDIDVYYYNSQRTKNSNKGVLIPLGCEAADRSTFMVAGNKNPYVVIQVINTEVDDDNNEIGDTYLIVSYHNDKNKFEFPKNTGKALLSPSNGFNAYTTSGGTHIYYTYRIRT